ncbi:MAG: histidine kinase [Clostridiales bacterium]|nr:histidine kinase [Clostridiales bacterium]
MLTLLFYRDTASLLESRASESLQQLAININQYLDADFEAMNDMAGRIIASQPIKNHYYANGEAAFTSLENQLEMFDLLFTVTGSSLEYQINIAGDDGRLVRFGKLNDLSYLNPERIGRTDWFAKCLLREGKPVITEPRENEWGRRSGTVVSVCRALNRTFGSRYDSVVEIQMPYDTVRYRIENSIALPDNKSNPGVVAFVYSKDGNPVYTPEGDNGRYFANTVARNGKYGTINLESSHEILAYSVSAFSGWTVVVREQEAQLLKPVGVFRNRVVLIGTAALFITLLITFLIARQLTVPIRNIQSSINKLELSHLDADAVPVEKTSTYELDKLGIAYQRMVNRLERSLNETVDARLQEMRARMLALQAQMDPHFLYNTITIISIKAEDNDDAEVVALCENLTGMLRYISKEAASSVTMAVELSYLHQYLFRMESRYKGQFEIDIDVPGALMAVVVPKLIVQPIIENCFKYAFDTHPPWKASVRGEMRVNEWRVTVTDNGKGFSAEALAAIDNRIRTGEFRFAAGETGNIGLLNIYYRLRFLYREGAVFSIENLPEGGSRVTIGGLVKKEDAHEW